MRKALIATVSSKGQVVIPAEVRRHLGIEQGDKLVFVLTEEGQVFLQTPQYPTVASLRGAAGSLSQPRSWAEMRRIAREDHLREVDLDE